MPDSNPFTPPESPFQIKEPTNPQEQNKGPEGLGGWLILVGIGVVLAPISVVVLLATTYFPILLDGTTWDLLTDPSSEFYNALWVPLIYFEVITNLLLLVMYIFLAILFFRKSPWFPKCFIALGLTGLGYVILDAWLASFVLPEEPIFDKETVRTVTRGITNLAIWGPYLMISKRSKNTFKSVES